MELTAKFIKNLPVESGVTNEGKEWKKESILVNTGGKYPKDIYIVLGKNVTANFNIGTEIKLHLNPDSREWKGKYFTTLTSWKIDIINDYSNNYEYSKVDSPIAQTNYTTDTEGDDLPF